MFKRTIRRRAILIQPDSAAFGVGEQFAFAAFAVTTAGDTVAASTVDIEWTWISSDTGTFTVAGDGTATGQSPGEAFCILDAELPDVSGRFTAKDSASVMVF